MFKDVKAPAAKASAPVKAAPVAKVEEVLFTPDGQPLVGGGVRYKVLCDGGINPSGVFWAKNVPPGASTADYVAAQAERDEALRQVAALTGAA